MTPAQRKRGRFAILTAGIVAGILSTIVTFILFGSNGGEWLIYSWYTTGIVAGSMMAVYICWKRYTLKQETKFRGAKYGALSGILAIAIMSIVVSWGNLIYEIITPQSSVMPDKIIRDVFISPFFIFFISVVFGGFLAPIAGAFCGYYFAKDKTKKA